MAPSTDRSPDLTAAPKIQLLLTGDELMSGDTVDSNSSLMARELNVLGLTPRRRVTLGDDRPALVAELRQLCRESDAVLMNGGLGPTVDDLTAEILAEVAGVTISEHPQAMAHLESWCAKRGLQLNEANHKQAMLPAGCEIIANPVGSAVGMAMEVDDCLVLCSPGVPGELRAMLPEMIGRLQERFAISDQKDVLRLQTFGIGESTVQQMVNDHCRDWPEAVSLSFRAGAPQLELKLTIANRESADLRAQCLSELRALFGDHIIGEGDTKIAEAVIDLARSAGLQLTCAESCTGGLIASMLTQIPGSSDAFPGGFVTYSNTMKAEILGVSQQTLDTDGAVSEATVREMLRGALRASHADLGVTVSGIAGPGGGSADKPVGTVWLAWGDKDHIDTACLCWPVERTLFQTMVAAAGLDVLRRRMLGIAPEPRYFEQRRLKRQDN
ncbi:MAG: CinA family nicotinamide mononucleotide deamidase-related protein [Congregibacter sp.]